MIRFFALCGLFVLCGVAYAVQPIRFGLAAAPSKLDPRFATDATSERIDRLIYTPLVDFDCHLKPIPKLGEWSLVSPIQYRFRLTSQGRQFHDGSRLTAADVQATYLSVLDPANASPHRASLQLIKRIEVLDDDTLDFHIDHPDVQFPAYLVIGIVPAARIAKSDTLSQNPIGSGPFRFVAWPNEGYLHLERVVDAQPFSFVRVPDPSVRALKLLRGELDIVQNDLMPELERWLARKKDVVLHRREGSNFTYLGFNLDDPVTGDLRVRQAIAHAIDRKAVLRYVFGGKQRIAQAIFPPEHWAAAPDLATISYDPERAKQLLADAGYTPQRRAKIIYKTSNDPFRVRVATILQDYLQKAGMDVELRSYDWGTFYGDIKAGRFQMFSLSWVGIKSPDIFRYAYHSTSVPPAGANRGRFRDPHVDALIEQAEREANPGQQILLYQNIQRTLQEKLPVVPLWYEDHVAVMKPDITGYAMAIDGKWDGLAQVTRGHEKKSAGQGGGHECP